MDDETFEQVIALVGRHGSTDHCQVPPEVLDHVWVDFAGFVLVAIVAPAWALRPVAATNCGSSPIGYPQFSQDSEVEVGHG